MRKDVPTGRSCYVSALRQELIARNSSYASLNFLPHVTSYGELPVVVYQQSECGRHHGNFIAASYRAILRRPQWRKRLQKVHSQGQRSLPAMDGSWCELDSSLSSDVLLMNIFCYPGVTRRREVCRILGLEPGSVPEFGFMPLVPLLSEATERTEVDMSSGIRFLRRNLRRAIFRSSARNWSRDIGILGTYLSVDTFLRVGRKYVSYQLIRNVLAAQALSLDFCTLLDARRPDLLEDWYGIVRCIRFAGLRARCKVLTWQELTLCLPGALQRFLSVKYGIVPMG